MFGICIKMQEKIQGGHKINISAWRHMYLNLMNEMTKHFIFRFLKPCGNEYHVKQNNQNISKKVLLYFRILVFYRKASSIGEV